MTISELMRKMIESSNGNHHDINHLMKVYTFAKTIGQLEGLPEETQYILEAAAIVHDIACPYCREKYGSAPGMLQEQESARLLEAFFDGTDIPDEQLQRISFLVCHHHTISGVDGPDYRILLEADFLVNADEGKLSADAIEHAKEAFFRTNSGIALLNAIYTVKNRSAGEYPALFIHSV